MPRALWSGSISFGLVNVPVKVYSAISEQDLHFRQFEEGTNARVRNKRVSEKTGREVPYEKIEKGYEVSKGNYVVIDPKELEEFRPRATRTIDIEDFVSLDEIDPVYFERTYWLVPDGGEGAQRAYELLRQAMEDQGKVAIGRVVMRTKQYLAALRPREGALAMSTMLFHDEVVGKAEIDGLPSGRKSVDDRELKMAGQIIDSLTDDWNPEKYHDTYREDVLEYIERKAKGEEIVSEEPEEERTGDVTDLLAALEASLEAAKKGRSAVKDPEAAKKAPARKATTARKTAAKKTSARKSTAKKTPAKKTPAKKTTAKKATAKKATGQARKSA